MPEIRSLQYGNRGPDVLAAQEKLHERGLMTRAQFQTGPGVYGPRTERAVKRLQEQTGLPPTGVLDPATRRVLFEDSAHAAATRGRTAARTLDTAPARPNGLSAPTSGGATRPSAPRTGFQGATALDLRKDAQGVPRVLDYTAKMTIDADGSPDVSKRREPGKIYDPDYQPTTSLSQGGKAVDANKVPFIVLPPELKRASGADLGDLARVEYDGKVVYAIFADVGPRGKLGEGSMELARSLGIDWNPRNGGVDRGVRYTVLPGSGDGKPHSAAEIQRRGAAAFQEARAAGLL